MAFEDKFEQPTTQDNPMPKEWDRNAARREQLPYYSRPSITQEMEHDIKALQKITNDYNKLLPENDPRRIPDYFKDIKIATDPQSMELFRRAVAKQLGEHLLASLRNAGYTDEQLKNIPIEFSNGAKESVNLLDNVLKARSGDKAAVDALAGIFSGKVQGGMSRLGQPQHYGNTRNKLDKDDGVIAKVISQGFKEVKIHVEKDGKLIEATPTNYCGDQLASIRVTINPPLKIEKPVKPDEPAITTTPVLPPRLTRRTYEPLKPISEVPALTETGVDVPSVQTPGIKPPAGPRMRLPVPVLGSQLHVPGCPCVACKVPNLPNIAN